MSTLLWLLAAHGLFFVLGLGLASRVAFLREAGWSVLLAPVAGHVALILIGLRLSTVWPAGRAVVAAAGVLALVTALSYREARQALQAWRRHRVMAAFAAAAAAVQLAGAAGLLAVGIETYNGYGNLDAWYYIMDTQLLAERRFFDVVAPASAAATLHTIPTATRVGPQLSVLLVDRLTGLDGVQSYNLVLASFLALLPLSVAFVAREVLALDLKWTLAAVLAAAVHSSLSLVYGNQHLGHLFGLCLVPLALAVLQTAATRAERDLHVAAGVLAAGCLFAYWPMVPLYVGPAAVLSSWLIATGRAHARAIATCAAVAGLVAAATGTRSAIDYVKAMAARRPVIERNDPAMVAFNPYLTEDLLPLATGLVHPGQLSALWVRDPPPHPKAARREVRLYLAAAAALLALATAGAAALVRAGRPLVPASLAVSGVLLAYVMSGEYGYGLYKLVSWTHVAWSLCFLAGLRACWQVNGGPGVRRAARLLAAGALAVYLVFNLRVSAAFARVPLARGTGRLVAQEGFSGNRGWRALERWAQRYREGPVLVWLYPHVAQYWAAFRLRATRVVALVPRDVMGAVSLEDQERNRRASVHPDANPPKRLDPEAILGCRYVLDWAEPLDVIENAIRAVPLERAGAFALYRMDDVRRAVSLHDGWHTLEILPRPAGGEAAFRWIRPQASLLLFRFPARPVRLVLGARSGLGGLSLERNVALLHRGQPIGGGLVRGGGRLLSEPFVPSGEIDFLEIQVQEPSRPLPRKVALWNRWVAQDPRSLALGVTDVRLVDEDELAAWARPTPGRYGPHDVRDRLLFGGLHADDWLGEDFELSLPAGAWRKLTVHGTRVSLHEGDLPSRVTVSVNGAVRGQTVLRQYGDFRVEVEAPPAPPGLDRVRMVFEHHLDVETFHTPGQDRRAISARLSSIELE